MISAAITSAQAIMAFSVVANASLQARGDHRMHLCKEAALLELM